MNQRTVLLQGRVRLKPKRMKFAPRAGLRMVPRLSKNKNGLGGRRSQPGCCSDEQLACGTSRAMQPYQQQFIELMVRHEVLRFGDFTLKSGRRSPYFVNAGQFGTGAAIAGLGDAYATCLEKSELACDLIFGPSYKGVPLAVSTACALASRGRDVPFCFDRKEAKDHGEGGWFVGTKPQPSMRVVLVDDVITSGRSVREGVALLRKAGAEVSGVIIAVDRQERGQSSRTTLVELRDELGLPVHPIVTIRQVVQALHGREVAGHIVVDDARRQAIEAYLAAHGGTD